MQLQLESITARIVYIFKCACSKATLLSKTSLLGFAISVFMHACIVFAVSFLSTMISMPLNNLNPVFQPVSAMGE